MDLNDEEKWLDNVGFDAYKDLSDGHLTWRKTFYDRFNVSICRADGGLWKAKVEWIPDIASTHSECFWCIGKGDTPDMALSRAMDRCQVIGEKLSECPEICLDDVATIRELTKEETSALDREFSGWYMTTFPRAKVIQIIVSANIACPYIVGLEMENNDIEWFPLIVPTCAYGIDILDIIDMAKTAKPADEGAISIGDAIDELKETISRISSYNS